MGKKRFAVYEGDLKMVEHPSYESAWKRAKEKNPARPVLYVWRDGGWDVACLEDHKW